MMPAESALETMRNSTVCPGRTPSPTLTENFYRAASKRGSNRSDPTAASTIGAVKSQSKNTRVSKPNHHPLPCSSPRWGRFFHHAMKMELRLDQEPDQLTRGGWWSAGAHVGGVARGAGTTARRARKEGLWRPRDLPQFASKGQQRADDASMKPPPARVEGVSSSGMCFPDVSDLSGRCAYCALKRPRDFSRPLLGAHQLLSHSRLAAVSRRALSYAPCLALDKILSDHRPWCDELRDGRRHG